MYLLRIQPHINNVTTQENLFQKGFLKLALIIAKNNTLHCTAYVNLLNALFIEVLIILKHICKICMNPPLVPRPMDHVINFFQFAESTKPTLCMLHCALVKTSLHSSWLETSFSNCFLWGELVRTVVVAVFLVCIYFFRHSYFFASSEFVGSS
jgi:hypothetical protein